MIRKTLRSLIRDQRGLTLVELIIAFLLAGVVTAGITVTTAHLLTGSTQTSNHMTAVRQVQSAGYWVSRDALQAQKWTISEPASSDPLNSGFPFTLEWNWEGRETRVTYSVTDDNRLMRTTVVTEGGVETSSSSPVAEHIDFNPSEEDPSKPSTRFMDGSPLSLRVTATVGGQSETRVYRIDPRPDG